RGIGVEAGQIVTTSLVVEPRKSNGVALADPARDLAKIAVIERHKGTGRVGVGFVTGFGLQRGAFASTHAHDAHNVVVVGVDEADMAAAVNPLAAVGGWQVAVADGRPLAAVRCAIGALVAGRPRAGGAAGRTRRHGAARVVG